MLPPPRSPRLAEGGGRVSLLPRTMVAADTVAGGRRTAPDGDDEEEGGDEDEGVRVVAAVEVEGLSPMFSYGWS